MSDFLSSSPENVASTPPSPDLAAVAAQEQAEIDAERLALEEMAKKEAEEQAKHFLSTTAAINAHSSVNAQPMDELTEEVLEILEADLDGYYQDFPEEAKARFLEKGKDVALEISGILHKIHVNTKHVLHLIRDWLLTIPGVNKFFLEQEAKVKTDRLRQLASDVRDRPSSP